MFKFIKEFFKDLDYIQKELNDHGIFTVYHQFGCTTYVDKTLCTHINNNDDKLNSIPKNDRQS